MSFTTFIAKFFQGGKKNRGDEFITLDRSGRARLDLAAYLSSQEGQKRVEDIAQELEKSARKIDEAA